MTIGHRTDSCQRDTGRGRDEVNCQRGPRARFDSGMTQPELPGPLAALTRLISERIAAADFAGALPLMNELVAVCRPILGERHPNVLDMKLALVHLQLQMGDQAGAYAVLEQLVPELEEVLGRDHITTLTARHMFADRPQPNGQAALAEWSQLRADEERVLGAEHPTALTSRDRVAHKRKELGDYAGAIAEGERVLAARCRVLGDHHEDTLGMRMSLAQWRGESVDAAGAVAELESLVEVMREKLGPDHRHTLIARHTVALWESEPEDYRDKVATWQALVDDEARVFGDDDPVTVAAREELTKWRDRVEEYRGRLRASLTAALRPRCAPASKKPPSGGCAPNAKRPSIFRMANTCGAGLPSAGPNFRSGQAITAARSCGTSPRSPLTRWRSSSFRRPRRPSSFWTRSRMRRSSMALCGISGKCCAADGPYRGNTPAAIRRIPLSGTWMCSKSSPAC